MPGKGDVNGVDVDALFETIDAIKRTPKIARFRFRAGNEWIEGGHNRTRIMSFDGAGEAGHERPEGFVYDADEPPLLLGRNLGANPVEFLLTALEACVTTALVYHAAARGINLRSVRSKVEGDIDLHGFLGIDPDVRKGYQEIRMTFDIDADATPEELDEILKLGPTFSPVYDSVTKGVPVQVRLAQRSEVKA
ncbi:MAG: OsmC family protein [Planctomycetota bacterium]|jgi:uncharacterized OsmC-like protein